MKTKNPFVNGLGGLLGTTLVRSWMGTLDCKIAYYDPAVDAEPHFQACDIDLHPHLSVLEALLAMEPNEPMAHLEEIGEHYQWPKNWA